MEINERLLRIVTIIMKYLMDQSKLFVDRKHAGIEVGKLLASEYDDRNVLVIGIPRGGVEVANYVAKILHGQLSIIVTKKLPFPGNEELAFGAVGEDGHIFLNPLANRLDETTIQRVVKDQLAEIESRVRKYRKNKPLPVMENRIVIVVDDGIATGATMVPALKLCKAEKAGKIIVAAPVSGDNYVSEIAALADEIKIVEQPEDFFAVGQVYEDFHGLSDEEVIALMNN
jgi:predicted phosphoribosyltransferase